MKFSIVNKLILGSILLVLISAGTVGGLIYYKTTELLVEKASARVIDDIDQVASVLKTHVLTQRDDTLFLANSPPVQGMLRATETDDFDFQGLSTYAQWLSRLELIFITTLNTKKNYSKIRYIDQNGLEKLVVSRLDGQPVSLSSDALQDKSNRPYVSETLMLAEGQVYISDINLNREHGKISIPHRGVLRSSTPIFNELTREVRGLLIITSDIQPEFDYIQEDIQAEGSFLYVTNQQGSYLVSPDAEKNYGFEFGHDYFMQADFVALKAFFSADNTATNHLSLSNQADGKHVLGFTKVNIDPGQPERYITVSITKPFQFIADKQYSMVNNIVATSLIILVFVIGIAIFFAYRLSRPLIRISQMMDDYTNDREVCAVMPVTDKDEIGVLARSYQALITQVEESKKGLENANENLELTVLERTKALKSSELFQRRIIETMVDGLIMIDDKGVVISFNLAAEKIFGYEAQEILGNNVNQLVPKAYRLNHMTYIQNYQKTGKSKMIGIDREVEAVRKDGSLFTMDIAVSEMEVDGHPVYSAVVRDITDRKMTERLKDEFVSTVSHELRTPLTSIQGSLGLISGGAVGEVPEKIKSLLAIAGNNSERLLSLINNMLDVQKIESGQSVIQLQNINLTTLLIDSIEENENLAVENHIRFVNLNSLEKIDIQGDNVRLKQVITNLLSNAAKYSPPDSTVEINAIKHEDDHVSITIVDQGTGIPEAFRSRVFDKFAQADASSTRATGGAGLGLSLCKMIVERHQGSIHFKTSESRGTVFTVTLPLR